MSETVTNFPRAAADVRARVHPLAHKALALSWIAAKKLFHVSAIGTGILFLAFWVFVWAGEKGFERSRTQFFDSAAALATMSGNSLVIALHRLVMALSRLPVWGGLFASVLLASFLIYGVIATVRAARA